MKIAILGFGLEGKSAYEYWQSSENEITICDQDELIDLPDKTSSQLGTSYLTGLDKFDLIVRSPAIHPSHIVEANDQNILQKVTTVTNEFLRICPSRNTIAITGTKGKGTTATLVAKMLEADGKRVHLGGNIGWPALDLLKNNIQPEDYIVLELSSFQLIDLQYSPHIGVCLMVVPEHLDWHADNNEYITAKTRLFSHQLSSDIAIYFADNETSRRIATSGEAKAIPYFAQPGAFVEKNDLKIDGQLICHLNELKLLGEHNRQNACAALTVVWQVTQDKETARSVLSTFSGLEHRLEFVRQLDGVKYYDDSFGTTPETAMVAIQAFNQPKVVILGGSDKKASYDQLAKVVQSSNVRSVVLIGLMAPKIQAALSSIGFSDFVSGGPTMPEVVRTARVQAQVGDVILLSTACASFDMFKNYKDRGDQFKKAVLALA
ncbi:MAG TPA: UDP-N-acetylmuramoyl-L-alanine--D-glutamate ligase [Candidatus Dormibacteraeota bacterium]|nr:UDP-N-acetylmuramoyl-L-alanine--D-glutamate ligase [Candidatus Dormibacteraeota bacterium]